IMYGQAKTMLQTLISIASGRGLLGSIPRTKVNDGDNVQNIFILTDRQSIDTAAQILHLLDPNINIRWFGVDFAKAIPSLASAEYMFNNNPYALIGKLEKDEQEQKTVASWYRST